MRHSCGRCCAGRCLQFPGSQWQPPTALQVANEQLEAALVETTRSVAAGGLLAQPSAADSEGDAAGELMAQLAVARGQLQAAEERVAQLEKLLKVGIERKSAGHSLYCVSCIQLWLRV